MDRRDYLVQTRLTPAEAIAVERVAGERGIKVGVLARELLVRCAMGEVIDAWSRDVAEWYAGRGQQGEDGTVHFKLRPLEAPRARELVVALFEHARDASGQDCYVGPCSSASLRDQDFVRFPNRRQLQLRGSQVLWRVAGTIDVAPGDGSKPFTKMFLERTELRNLCFVEGSDLIHVVQATDRQGRVDLVCGGELARIVRRSFVEGDTKFDTDDARRCSACFYRSR